VFYILDSYPEYSCSFVFMCENVGVSHCIVRSGVFWFVSLPPIPSTAAYSKRSVNEHVSLLNL